MKLCRLIIECCFIAGICTIPLQAQYQSAGSVSYQHLLLDYDARSVGMAGASVAVPGNSIGVFANSALPASVKRMEALVGYQLVLDGVWGAPLGISRRFPGVGVITVALQGLTSGNIEVVEEGLDHEPLYTGRSAYDQYISSGISLSRAFLNNQLHAGITLRGLYRRLNASPETYSSKAIAFDLGVQYFLMSDRLVLGAVVRNAGMEVSSFVEGTTYPLPLMFEAGVSYVPRYLSSVRLALDVNKIRGEYAGFEPGLEVEIYPRVLFARFGYAFSQSDLSEQFKKFSGDQDENYQKSNWSTLCTGIGIRTGMQQVKIQVDIGLEFRVSWLPPSPVVSALVEF
ncbi:MAG: hypothetical protein JW863_19150 [Chitinispirillaceae bacterium]|nr:hypothetical protein [Chitinispirillaceae bacterium]